MKSTRPVMLVPELTSFMTKHDFTADTLADLLGQTRPAVDHWLRFRRSIPPTVVKLVRFFDKYPEAMKVF